MWAPSCIERRLVHACIQNELPTRSRCCRTWPGDRRIGNDAGRVFRPGEDHPCCRSQEDTSQERQTCTQTQDAFTPQPHEDTFKAGSGGACDAKARTDQQSNGYEPISSAPHGSGKTTVGSTQFPENAELGTKND